MSKKVHCILCDRKYPVTSGMMGYIRLPRNKITVPVCVHCIDRYDFWARETICLADVIGPVMDEAINNAGKTNDKYETVIEYILKVIKEEGH